MYIAVDWDVKQQNIQKKPPGGGGGGKSNFDTVMKVKIAPNSQEVRAKDKKVSEYDQEISQPYTADQPMAPRGRA